MQNSIIKGINEYYNNIKINDKSRYKTWEHCYVEFYNVTKNGDKIKK